ncbi:ion transporter [Siccirubricoccus sp. KC 17139]|uniref:Ion transporter n=1 Tax=Siccirubricoccus soli TaxID=2899147 RepID=A0ABT1D602_9PROT|nr:ion transporter [Siccirubricoccus soli]MCO6417341.1 ion transporter [Siccirubricoccus soli]MCP2683476.1 ion transporter [Siccirubricoccus soli]
MQEIVTTADADGSSRARVAQLVASPGFQTLILSLIGLNAVILGLETWPSLMAGWGGPIGALDHALLAVFTLEIALRIYAFRGRFFQDPWGLFDLVVVAIAWVPAAGPFAVLRVLRVLRILRLVSLVPSLRVVVEAMLASIPGMASIVALMLLLFYVCAVMTTQLFGADLPERFGTFGDSLLSLFQLMTLEGWPSDIAFPLAEKQPWAWLFVIPFILVATFVVLNLFIGVIVDSISTLKAERETTVAAEARAEAQADQAVLLREIRALRAEVAALREAGLGKG